MLTEMELKLMEEVNQQFDIDELVGQLESVVISRDPIGYMQTNINWEIDKNVETSDDLSPSLKMMASQFSSPISYEAMRPLKKFLNWLKRSKPGKSVKQILCSIAAKIKALIDEEAKLKELLGVALAAIVAALGIGAINPVLLTILVGYLATMILDGVDAFCEV